MVYYLRYVFNFLFMRKLEPTYRDALTKSWHFVWHHKIIWILSLCAAIFTHYGLSDFVGQVWLVVSSPAADNWWSPVFWSKLTIPNGIELIGVAWLLIILLSLCALLIVLAICSQGALIIASCSWFKNKTTPKFLRIWNQGAKHFWRLLAINVFQKILLAKLLIILTFFFSFFSIKDIKDMLVTVIVMGIVLFLALVVSSITIYASGYIVEKEYSFFEALASAWQMFSQHLLVSLELSFILLLLNIVLILAIAGSSILVLIPAVFILIVGGVAGSNILLIVGLLVALGLLLLAIAILGGIFNAFTTSAWMYLFMKMHVKRVPSRLIHYAARTIRR